MMSAALTIDFFHDTVCCWCFNISKRLRTLSEEFDLDIRHRTFVLQASRAEMSARWGSPNEARTTILGHWTNCRDASDQPDRINIDAMRMATFDYPHGWAAGRACKAAETIGGQVAHWDMFDRIQSAHLTEARNIADATVLIELASDVGLDSQRFSKTITSAEVAQAVNKDRQYARQQAVRTVPSLIVRETGALIKNGPIEQLRAQLRDSARSIHQSKKGVSR